MKKINQEKTRNKENSDPGQLCVRYFCDILFEIDKFNRFCENRKQKKNIAALKYGTFSSLIFSIVFPIILFANTFLIHSCIFD